MAVLCTAAAAWPAAAAGADRQRSARLVAAGDIACEPGVPVGPTRCRHAYTAQLVQALDPDVVATLGDAQWATTPTGSRAGASSC